MLSQNVEKNNIIDVKISENTSKIFSEAAEEGIILLKNDKKVLPISDNDIVSLFGVNQIEYFYNGYGSGGNTTPFYKISPVQGFKNHNIKINEELLDTYTSWLKLKKNHKKEGRWGHYPFSNKEMTLSDELVKNASYSSNIATIFIGRNAGEDQDMKLKKGSYYLTDIEKEMISLAKKYFKKTCLIINTSNIIDFKEINDFNLDSIILAYQGGMKSGNALARIINGESSPSGKLNDTISYDYLDYPSSECFNNRNFNYYKEDIFVGYRFFNTFKRNRIMYPFGFGLSYTSFSKELIHETVNKYKFSFEIMIKNTGNCSGKEVVQIYLNEPKGYLSKAENILVGFTKSKLLKPQESEVLTIDVDLTDFSHYDEETLSYVIEKGVYDFYIGNSSIDLVHIYSFKYEKDYIVRTTKNLFYVEHPFKRMSNSNGTIKYENIKNVKYDLKDRILDNIKDAIPLKENQNLSLLDVKNSKVSLDDFIASLSIKEMNDLLHGEGKMNSPLGTSGNGGAFGGVTKELNDKGIPPIIVSDGPTGLRVNYKSSMAPIASMLASTYNKELIFEVGKILGNETIERNVDMLLGPGLNIHRNPLCGRNFEYYSEDPLLSGTIAGYMVKGIESTGALSCPKHFLCNHQEKNRIYNDSRVSVKALREIYLRNFEYMVKIGNPSSIMTSYNMINGVYGHYCYDSVIGFMREEIGYDKLFITDWWMRYKESKEFELIKGNAYRIRSGINVLMPGDIDTITNKYIGNSLLETYGMKDGITLSEIENNVRYVLNAILNSPTMNK